MAAFSRACLLGLIGGSKGNYMGSCFLHVTNIPFSRTYVAAGIYIPWYLRATQNNPVDFSEFSHQTESATATVATASSYIAVEAQIKERQQQ